MIAHLSGTVARTEANSVVLDVNGRRFSIRHLHSGRERTIDIARAMHQGDNNTVALAGFGASGSSGDVIIWDGNGSI